jgi:hypothetical protein
VGEDRFEFGAEEEGAVVEQGIVERLPRQGGREPGRVFRGYGPRGRRRTCHGSGRRSVRPKLPRRAR